MAQACDFKAGAVDRDDLGKTLDSHSNLLGDPDQ